MPKTANKRLAYALGFTIAQERKKRGWSATELARRLEVSRSCVSSWEIALSSPTWGNMVNMMTVMRLTPSAFMRLVEHEVLRLKDADAAKSAPASRNAKG
jgi:transcriptional regulator with XRE-family HTH domain